MGSKKKILRPIEGMDQDTALNRRNNNSVYETYNMRINSDDSMSFGEWTNVKGSNKIMDNVSDYNIRKVVKVGNFYAFFIHATSWDYIYLLDEQHIPRNGDDELTLNTTYVRWYSSANLDTDLYHIYRGDLGLTDSNDLSAVGYYESDDVQKIYWSVEGQPLRSLNVIYNSETNDLYDVFGKPENLNAIPNAVLERPEIGSVTSGSLKSGKVHYAYKLINSSGGETQLSELSVGFNVTSSSSTDVNDYDYSGDTADTTTGKGMSVEVSSIANDFTKIKMYAIHYLTANGVPTIRLIFDGNVSGSFTTIDTGDALSTITPEEFVSVSALYTDSGNVSTMNNRLFLTNYNEQTFDIDEANGSYWDARAYRFVSGAYAIIYDSDLSSYLKIRADDSQQTGTVMMNAVPETHDCINQSNDINNWDWDDNDENWIYQVDGNTLGASGINVSIDQETSQYHYLMDTSNESTKFYAANSSSQGYYSGASEWRSGYRMSFKPDEVYRLAIQFRNAKGQLSQVKWICDYKITLSRTGSPYFGSLTQSKAYLYYLKVTVSNIPIDPDTGTNYEWRMMYVPLTDDDESVHFGAMQAPMKYGSTGYRAVSPKHETYDDSSSFHHSSRKAMSWSDKYIEFMNPEYCFGKNKSYKMARIFKETSYLNIEGGLDSSNQINRYKAYYQGNPGIYYFGVDGQYNLEYSTDLAGSIPLDGTDEFLRAGETVLAIKNGYWYKPTGDEKFYIFGNSNKGKCQILKNSRTSPSNYLKHGTHHGCCYIDNFTSRYGGLTYNVRQSNSYVALSEFSTSSLQSVFGDSIPSVFEYLRQISDNTNALISGNQIFENNGFKIKTTSSHTPGVSEIISFPIYSRINMKLRGDDYLSKVYLDNGSYLIHESAGVYQESSSLISPGGSGKSYVNPGNYVYTQGKDMYIYNNTYSRVQDLIKYAPVDFSSETSSFKSRIIASGLKIAGSSSDGMLQLQASSYVDVDGRYGKVVKTIEFNNKMYFFQEDAIGVVPVNERQTQTTSDGSQLVIGNTELLSRFDYATRHNGVSNARSVCITPTAMYAVDDKRGEILKITDKVEKISITKGVNSILKNKYWSDTMVVYNRRYNEILFFYKLNSTTDAYKALVFNENIDKFTSIYDYDDDILSYAPIGYGTWTDELVVADDYEVYTLNDGSYNYMFNSSKSSYITFLATTENESIVLFNALEFMAKQIDSSGSDITDFIYSVDIWDGNQSTSLSFSSTTAFQQKFGKWRTNKLRSSGARYLSDHLYIKIQTTTNDDVGHKDRPNYRVFIRDMIVHYMENHYFGK